MASADRPVATAVRPGVWIGIGVGLVVASILLVSGLLLRAAEQGASRTSRLLQTSQLVDQIRGTTQPDVIRLLAYVQLVRQGDAGFHDALQAQTDRVSQDVKELKQLAMALAPQQWALLRKAERAWQELRDAIGTAVATPLDPVAMLDHAPDQALTDRATAVQRTLETLQSNAVTQLDAERLAAEAWPRQFRRQTLGLAAGLIGALVVAGLLLRFAISRGSHR